MISEGSVMEVISCKSEQNKDISRSSVKMATLDIHSWK